MATEKHLSLLGLNTELTHPTWGRAEPEETRPALDLERRLVAAVRQNPEFYDLVFISPQGQKGPP